MKDYELVFRVDPPGFFGLPDGDRTVLPAGVQWEGPPIDTYAGCVVGHSTPSRFREQPAVHSLQSESAALTITDNFLQVVVGATSPDEAVVIAERAAARFCMALSAAIGQFLDWTLIGNARISTKRPFYTVRRHEAGNVTFYCLPQLKSGLEWAASCAANLDPMREKALAYCHHALFLRNEYTRLVRRRVRADFHAYLVASEVILNCYKSATTIFGEGGQDSDHQRRWRELGYPEELKADFDNLKDVRDEMDVAHYRADWVDHAKMDAAMRHGLMTAVRIVGFSGPKFP